MAFETAEQKETREREEKALRATRAHEVEVAEAGAKQIKHAVGLVVVPVVTYFLMVMAQGHDGIQTVTIIAGLCLFLGLLMS